MKAPGEACWARVEQLAAEIGSLALSEKWVIDAIIARLDGIQRTTLREEENR